MIIDNAGVALHVAQDGDPDGPTVLVLHGITSCTATWDWLVPHLAADYRVLRLDFRGHGQSGRAEGTYHFPSYLSDAVAVCEQVAGGPCVVLGHSLGGGTAAALAQKRRDLVRAIVLEDPALAGSDQQRGERGGGSLLAGFQLVRQSVPMMQQLGTTPEQLVGILAMTPATTGGATLGDSLHPDAIAAIAVGLLQLDATVLDPVLEASMVAAFDANATIPVPTLVLAADGSSADAVVREPDIALLAQHSPHADVRVVAGAGHLIHDSIAHRATLLDAVLDFLAVNAG